MKVGLADDDNNGGCGCGDADTKQNSKNTKNAKNKKKYLLSDNLVARVSFSRIFAISR